MTDPSPDILFSLYHSGAWLCLGIVAAFVALRYAAKHVAWLEEPGRAHYITAALAALAVLVVPAAQGTTPNAQTLMSAGSVLAGLLLPGLL